MAANHVGEAERNLGHRLMLGARLVVIKRERERSIRCRWVFSLRLGFLDRRIAVSIRKRWVWLGTREGWFPPQGFDFLLMIREGGNAVWRASGFPIEYDGACLQM
ncbi:hypothetical protein ZIOFF_011714 [Zingiber officinale]|uniref:Uncharacterized protein n=1 Tax=Zingiber officinale TaxID=94328 RepID=A0A8J5HYN6_ZINOF|nr:hypothetical protein ZIOFF_011714 [Zingiber officinale]